MSLATSLAAIPGVDLRRAAGTIMEAAADITLLVDGTGVVRRASAGERAGPMDPAALEGIPVGAIVERGDQAALEDLIAAAARGDRATVALRHLPPGPTAAPVRYTALGRTDGAVLLVGRLVPEPPALAGEPAALLAELPGDRRRRAMEARYRALFDTAAEAVMIVSLDTGQIEEANPRALDRVGAAPDVAGRPLAALFDPEDGARLARHLAMARDGGEFAPLRLRLAGSGRPVALEGRVFRAFDRTQLMLRIGRPGAVGADRPSPAFALVARLMRESPNALALTDGTGRVTWANAAFEMLAGGESAGEGVGAGAAGGVQGRTIADLTEFSGAALDAVLGSARERGRISLRDIRLRRGGAQRAAEGRLTVISLPDDAGGGFGLVFRAADAANPDEPGVAPGVAAPAPAVTAASAVPAEIDAPIGIGTGANGGATMKELLRDATDAIERTCIDTALRLTGGNRAAAAKALGLSRQGLYVKMRRFGLD